MKNLILFLSIAFCGNEVLAQGHYYPPQNIQDAYRHDYPGSEKPIWVQINGEWRAQFRDHGPDDLGEMTAYYDRFGHRLDTHIPYDREDVPPVVLDRHRQIFKDGRITGYNRIVGPDEHTVFEIQFNHKGRSRSAYYDEDGRDRQYDDHH
jgi:hypothetical protein